MGVWRSLGGSVSARLTSADPFASLQLLAERGVVLYGIVMTDPLTAEFAVQRKDIDMVSGITNSRGEKLEILQYGGLFWRVKSLLHRKALLAGLALLAFLALYLPTRVLFIRVEGNSRVPAALIQEMAADCGIRFGASRAEVRSEQVKNTLLQAIPQLQWVGVNTAGCSATISVRERATPQEDVEQYTVSRIIACRDGIISTVVCTGGNVLVTPGQAVREGETLISGYTDCGFSIRAERAQGEVFAFTTRQITAILPKYEELRGEQIMRTRQFSLIIGKKRINLWIDSGISCSSCVKIYEEKWVSLPGDFHLPVKLAVETWICYDRVESEVDTFESLRRVSVDYLLGQMISGTILTKKEEFTQEEAFLVLEGQYECLEMIGRERGEEIVHGKND